MPWWTIAFVAAMTLGLWSLGWRKLRPRTRELVDCQEVGKRVLVDFARRATPTWQAGRKIDVARCSAFANPERVACDKHCLAGPRAWA